MTSCKIPDSGAQYAQSWQKEEWMLHSCLGMPVKCPWGSLRPLENLQPYALSPNLFKPQGFPPSPSFRRSHKIMEGGRNYTKIPLSSGEENMWIRMWLWIQLEITPEQNTLKNYPKNEDVNF